MEQNIVRKEMWNIAAHAGLVLGSISIAYMFITQWIAGTPSFINVALNMLLWAAKSIGCIWMMMHFMKKYVAGHPKAENRDTFNLGMATALLSALVYSAAVFANVAFISEGAIIEQMNLYIQNSTPVLDSNSLAMMETFMQKLPQITFFSNLIYCTAFGTVLSFILSRNIPSRDPFAEYKPDQQ